jgi:G3E family GTPase
LGSGKSTLLNGLLRNEVLSGTAVVVNELGEVGIDNRLIEQVTEGVTLLTSGCLCCAVRTDLEFTLRDLYLKRTRGVIPQFSRLVIETTGLASPGPILQTLLSWPLREQHYATMSVVATVDAVNAQDSLSRFTESVQQVAIADRLIVTKTDLSDPVHIACLESRLRDLNPLAPIIRMARGLGTPHEVLGQDFLTGTIDESSHLFWATSVAEHDARRENRGLALREPTDSALHTSGIRADSFIIMRPIDWELFSRALQSLLDRFGANILRFKGILRVQDVEEAVAVHGVHHTFYPPDLIAQPVCAASDSRLVFISQAVERAVFEDFVRKLTPQSPS